MSGCRSHGTNYHFTVSLQDSVVSVDFQTDRKIAEECQLLDI